MHWTCLAVFQLHLLMCFTLIKGLIPTISGDVLTFTRQPDSKIYIPHNLSVFVPCEATGIQPLTIDWRNESVLNSPVVINASSNGLWFTNDVQRTRSSGVHRVGIFRCVASNTAGVLFSEKFDVSFTYLQGISVQLASPVLLNNVVRITCIVDTNQPVKLSWFKDNIELDTSQDKRLETSGILRIIDYKASDNGIYSCQARTGFKVITSKGVKVFGNAAVNTSVHVYPGKVIRTTVGNPLVIECIHYGPRKSSLSWLSSTKKLATAAGYVNLEFDSVQQSNGGEYRCVSTDGVEQTVHVFVEAPPSFKSKLPALTRQDELRRLVLTCNATGTPTPSVTWYRNGRKIFHSNGSETNLVIDRVRSEHRGIYQCEIENKHGSKMDQTILDVIDLIQPPGNVRGYAISSTVINITWEKPPDLYGEIFYNVHLTDWITRTDRFGTITKKTYQVINYLKAFRDYLVRVEVYTLKGKKGTCAFFIKTLEDAPGGKPNDVKLTSYSSGSLDVTWLPPFLTSRNGKIISYEIRYRIEGSLKENNVTISKNFYSTPVRNLVPGNKRITAKNFYSAILRQLVPGKKYFVRVAAKTAKGRGPFSKGIPCIISEKVAKVIPAPSVIIKYVNETSIVLSVESPPDLGIKGYQLIYKVMGTSMDMETKIRKDGASFEYVLNNTEMDAEYVINVSAFDDKMSYGRPKIFLLARNTSKDLNRTMFDIQNHTYGRSINVSCELVRNATAIAVKWARTKDVETKFEVRYSVVAETYQRKTVLTKHLNMTIEDVSPGEIYHLQVRTVIRRRPGIFTFNGLPRTKLCRVPEKEPVSPPHIMECTKTGSKGQITWLRPDKPNGHIVSYEIVWFGPKNETMKTVVNMGISEAPYSYTLENVSEEGKSVVYVRAKNSVGFSPFGRCTMHTEETKDNNKPQDEPGHEDTGDVEKGIIIGCIISVLVLCLLVLFVCWSGLRRHKKRSQARDTNPLVRTSHHPDTITTDISDLSTKHQQIVKKFIDPETSKESDRGLGMTPKSSRQHLDSEKIPFLPKTANQDGSVDTSCDSNDSGVQGLGKKASSAQDAPKDPDKILHGQDDFIVETKC
ncbi:protogenin-like [Dendronephthya gigantea]|uniref:protogenin-like n=1 Tax=Dendronephthya gigantea TaxID=151771 RepID=UPI00106BA9DA|nr:protogenin-like [Dendronephthya gigantea]